VKKFCINKEDFLILIGIFLLALFFAIKMSHRPKVTALKLPKQEQELRIITNPLADKNRRRVLQADDYVAPLSARSLKQSSKWIIVRNNIHKIRSWGGLKRMSVIDQRFQEWYLFFQMRRELRRAQEQIKTIQSRPDFVPVHYFDLPVDETHVRRYNVSHVKESDAIYYPGFGREPIVLQSLLYYFTEECHVPYNSIFRTFLSDVCSVLNRERERINRAAVFRKVALIVAIAVFIILALMLFSLVLSVFTTTSKLSQMYQFDSDGGVEWRQSKTTLGTTLDYL
jgi:hypothetical protein